MCRQNKREILIVGPSWVGDMVMAQSLFKTIKNTSPNEEITVLAPDWSEPILQRMPEVSSTVTMPVGHGSLQLRERYRLASELREKKFHQAIVLPGSLKSALIPWFARIPARTGFVGEQRYGLLNDIRKLDPSTMPLNVQRYVSLGLPNKKTIIRDPPAPRLSTDPQQLSEVLSRFVLHTDRPILGLCPGAEYGPAKQWPAAHFAKVARTQKSKGWQIWIFGSHRDQGIADEINELSDFSCISLAGKTSLGEAVDLMSIAKYVVTNDSGLMHIAAAVNAHVIAIYGSSSDQFTPPLTDKCHRLSLNLDCSPCYKRTCPLGHTNCLNQLLPGQVNALIL